MTVPARTDVVVIGAGLAGLSAAYHLRRRGPVLGGLSLSTSRGALGPLLASTALTAVGLVGLVFLRRVIRLVRMGRD